MAFLHNTNRHFLKLLYVTLLLAFAFISCNTVADKGINGSDSVSILTLENTGAVSAEDSALLSNACRQWYDTVLMPKGFNGGMLVAKNGHIIFEVYNGTAHIPGADRITAHTPMHIASVSKTFTAMAILKLMQEGKLNLDDEFSKFFPQFNFQGVTIRCLLSHRSGLPNYNYFMETLGWDKSRYVSNHDVMNYLISRKAELADLLPPDLHFRYSNTNYALLALLIEKISGKTYADYINQSFFRPLQMNDSYVFKLSDTLKATPSYNWKGVLEPFNFLDQVYGDKNIYTTVRDLLIWDRALNSNLLFTEETLQLAYAPYSNEKPGMHNYGLGWRMNIFPDGNKIIYHNGWWHGSNAAFIRLVKEQATIIAIGNKFTRSVYHSKILTSLFGNYYSPVDEGEPEAVKDSLVVQNDVLKTDSVTKKKRTARLKKK